MIRCNGAALAVLLWAGAALAQATGAVQGAVADADGASIEGALVILLPMREGREAIELETGADGRFAHPDVPSGFYTVTAALGDQRSEVYRIQVRDGRVADIRFILEAGRSATPWLGARGEESELDSLFDAGVAANRNGAYAEAITYFNLGAQLFPGCVECYYNAGVAHGALEQWDEAERAFHGALSVQPDYSAAYYGLSDIYGKSGRPEDAIAAREEATRLTLAAIATNREQASDAVELGIVLREAGNLEGARARFEEATTHDPQYAPAYYWLGVTLSDLSDPAASTAALYRYLALDETGEYADDARSRLAVLDP
ncbi:MAG: tetratricopeptide repeat protein [Acidobacteria bacterium]|nr:tetratricopeptide repeat protein [Acidobacteriota bacterium]